MPSCMHAPLSTRLTTSSAIFSSTFVGGGVGASIIGLFGPCTKQSICETWTRLASSQQVRGTLSLTSAMMCRAFWI